MKKITYSKEIAHAINEFLTEDDWKFLFDEERGLFKFGISLKGKLKKIKYVIDVKDDEYLVYAISPIGADEDDDRMMANMAEFLCRANYSLIGGNFEFDFRDGEIRFKYHVSCEDITPSAAMIKNSIYSPATTYDRYGPGIISIIFNDSSAKEAYSICEDNTESELRELLARFFSDDENIDSENDDLESLLDCFAARLGISPDGSGQTSEDTNNTDIDTDLFGTEGGDNV